MKGLVLLFTFFTFVGCGIKNIPVELSKQEALKIQKKIGADGIYIQSMYKWVDGKEKYTLAIVAESVKDSLYDFKKLNQETLEVLKKEKQPLSRFDAIKFIYEIYGTVGGYRAYVYDNKLELKEVEIYGLSK